MPERSQPPVRPTESSAESDLQEKSHLGRGDKFAGGTADLVAEAQTAERSKLALTGAILTQSNSCLFFAPAKADGSSLIQVMDSAGQLSNMFRVDIEPRQ